jgi:hypothetical protein
MAGLPQTTRLEIGKRRIANILRNHVAATLRTLEQKISDAGPTNQRVDPHLLTNAQMTYPEFAARSKRRLRGEPEDGYPPEHPNNWI